MIRIALRVTLGFLFAAGCGRPQEARRSNGATVRDSAGIEVVTNAQSEHLLSIKPVLKVGVVEGDPNYLFARVRAIALDTSGGIWVVDGHPSIRHYDSAGAYIGRVGGRGRGPGEAHGYGDVWVGNEKVLAWGNPTIIQLFATDGTLLGSRVPLAGDRSFIFPIGFARERWYFSVQQHGLDRGDVYRPLVLIVAGRELSGDVDTIQTFPGALRRRVTGGEIGRASYFFGDPSFAIDGSGRLFLSDTLHYRIALYDVSGKLVRIVQRPVSAPTFDPNWVPAIEEAVAAALRRDGSTPVNLAERDRLVASIVPSPAPAHLPVIRRIFVAIDGEFWVERADRHPRPAMRAVAHAFGYVRHAWRPEWTAPQVFDLFNASGAYRGTVELPALYEPMEVTAERVYGVLYDELGVEYVAIFEIASGENR